MFSVPPPEYQIVNSNCIRNPSDGRCYPSIQAAWESFLDRPSLHLPPGFVQVPSVSRPGQISFFSKTSGEKYATVDLAWRAYLRKQPSLYPPAPRLVEESEGSSDAAPLSAFMSASRFVDAAFPHSDASIGPCVEEDASSRLGISLQQKKNIKWLRLPEVIAQMNSAGPAGSGNEVCLFGSIDIHHLIQGVAGDCWLLATLACLAEFPHQIQALFLHSATGPTTTPTTVTTTTSPVPATGTTTGTTTGSGNSKIVIPSETGKYLIRIYDVSKLEWEVVTIDDTIPCVKSHGRYEPLFARPFGNEMWAVLLEKAMAKFVGTYADISGGHEAYALMALTGFPQVYQFRRSTIVTTTPTAVTTTSGEVVENKLWTRGWSQYNKRTEPSCGFRPSLDNTQYSNGGLFEKLADYDSRDYLLAASITNFKQPKTPTGFFREDGLVLGHSYSLISVVEVVTTPLGPAGTGNTAGVKLVQLRNPHGAGRLAEWKGAWSDESEEWDRYPAVRATLDHVKSDDGVFWMPFEDFANIFDRVLVLCKPMGMQRDLERTSLRRESHMKKAEIGRAALGMALKRTVTNSALDAIKRMSVQTYDPYLNVPDWIRKDQMLLRDWVKEKGEHL